MHGLKYAYGTEQHQYYKASLDNGHVFVVQPQVDLETTPQVLAIYIFPVVRKPHFNWFNDFMML